MADTLSGLAKKHNGFFAPEYSIEINNTNLTENFLIDDFRLELTAGYEASGLSFTIKNGFEGAADFTSKLNSNAAKLIKPGNITEASVGYGSGGKAKLFLGYIDSVYIDYAGAGSIEILVECLDAKGIMMNSRRSEVKKDVKKCSEAIKSILGGYAKLITKQTVEQSPETAMVEQHNESDYDFIVREAKKNNCAFYIINGEAVFRPNGKSQSPILKIKKNDLLKSFSLHMSLKQSVSEVIVRSGNEKEPSKPVEGKATGYKSIAGGDSVTVKNPSVIPKKTVQMYIDHSAASQEEAKILAEARLAQLSFFRTQGRLECVGAPEIIPGKIIELEGFGAPCDMKYYINKASHIINQSGYVTQCELGADLI